jgi:DNA-directed RNA polymerase specialized sigma24 family protein
VSAALMALAMSLRWFVIRAVKRMGVRVADAEDITQEVMWRAAVAIERGNIVVADGRDAEHALRNWLYVVTWRVVHRTKSRSPPPMLTLLERDVLGLRMPDPVERLEAREVLRRVPGWLNRSERELVGAIARGEDVAAIARARGVPSWVVWGELREIRFHLRRLSVKRAFNS